METFTQELNDLLDYLLVLERRLSRTLYFTVPEMPSWEQLSEVDQMRVLQLGNDISVVCHHLQSYRSGLPDKQHPEESKA